MRKKPFYNDIFTIIPLILSGLLCIGLLFLFRQKLISTPDFNLQLSNLSSIFIGISGFLSAIILIYLVFSTVGLKTNRNFAVESLSKITQKMHDFRTIIEILMQSKMWLPGLKEFIDDEFEGLTFFDVKEFYKGKSKLAIEFLQENKNYTDTETLYLEMKSLLLTNPKEKKVAENISYPSIYNKDIVEKWLEHKCGSGLWYYFGYKFGAYKEALKIESVFERHQDKIMTLANTIDHEVFEDSSFNEVFLSKLGEYMSNEVIPKLYQVQENLGSQMPRMMRYLYLIFVILVLFGVLLPLLFLLFNLSIFTLALSFSLVISLIFYITTSLYQFLQKEINN